MDKVKAHDIKQLYCKTCHSKLRLKSQINKRMKIEKLQVNSLEADPSGSNLYVNNGRAYGKFKQNLDSKNLIAKIKANAEQNINRLRSRNKTDFTNTSSSPN